MSDEAALRALLSETAAKEQHKKDHQQQQQQSRKRFDDSSRRQPQDPQRNKRHRSSNEDDPKNNNYYGPGASVVSVSRESSESAAAAAAKPNRDDDDNTAEEAAAAEKKRPNFGLSGALAKDQSGAGGSNVYKGVLLKFQEPPEARTPNTQWRFYVFRGEEQIETLHVSKQSAYLFARNEDIADIPLMHPSCSSQHAVLQYRALPSKETGKLTCQPYLMDLESTNGSFINGVRIDAARYYQLKKGDVLKFGSSTREYVLLSANTKSLK